MTAFFNWVYDLWWAIVAALVLTVGGFIWRGLLRRKPGLSGTWKATYTSKDGTEIEEDIEIISLFGRVRGNSTSRWNEPNGEQKNVSYRIRGRSKERTIVAIYIAVDSTSLDRGVFIVRIRPGGRVGDGIVTSYDSPTNYEDFDFEHLDASTNYHWKKVLKQ
jgi:hypothetical protein